MKFFRSLSLSVIATAILPTVVFAKANTMTQTCLYREASGPTVTDAVRAVIELEFELDKALGGKLLAHDRGWPLFLSVDMITEKNLKVPLVFEGIDATLSNGNPGDPFAEQGLVKGVIEAMTKYPFDPSEKAVFKACVIHELAGT